MARSYVRLNFNLSDEDYQKLILLQKYHSTKTNQKYNISDLLRKFINDDWENNDMKNKRVE